MLSKRAIGPFRAVILDLDGVLLDSIDAMRVAWRDVQCAHQVAVPFERYYAHLGRPFAQIMAALGLGDIADQAAATYDDAAQRSAHLVRPYAGVPSALRQLSDEGCRLAVVTSKPRRRAEPLVEGLGCVFDAVVTPDDAPGKPAPDGIHVALTATAAELAGAVYVGDTVVDRQAAQAAGIAYAHAAWGYGEPGAPLPAVLSDPSALAALGASGRPRRGVR